jgi:uncharacterized membrane protein
MTLIIVYFCIYSVFGWGIDTASRSFAAKKYKAGGFSKYPFSPIYGFAALGILAAAPYVKGWSILLQWLFFALTLATYEYLSGVVTHRVFKRRLWNYSRDRWDIKGYTGPGYAAVWGVLALLLIKYIQPFLEARIGPLP